MTERELAEILEKAERCLKEGRIVIPVREKRKGFYEVKKRHEFDWLDSYGIEEFEVPDLICRLFSEIRQQGVATVYSGKVPPQIADEPKANPAPMISFTFYTLEIGDFDEEV